MEVEVTNSEKGRSDLTAIDEMETLFLLRLNDVDDISARKEELEFQAIRYAAGYAKIKTPEELVERYLLLMLRDMHMNLTRHSDTS